MMSQGVDSSGSVFIGIFESLKYDVNPKPNTRGIGPLVGRTSCYPGSYAHFSGNFEYNLRFLLYLTKYFHSSYIVW